MILIDFRNWIFNNSLGVLPNARKELLKRDFETIKKVSDFKVLDFEQINPLTISSLFFKNNEQIAVSPVKDIRDFYQIIDTVLEVEDKEVIDYTEAADEEVYFYGQNSLVAHFEAEIALCGINNKTDESLFEEYCEDFELTPFGFDIPEGILTSDIAIFLGNTLLICLEYITDKKLKKQLFSLIKGHGIETLTFTKEQVAQGVFDMKFVDGKLITTQKVFELLTKEQKEAVLKMNTVVLELPFLEKVGIKLRDIIL